MASFFNTKGTTQHSFQIGLRGPIIESANISEDNVVKYGIHVPFIKLENIIFQDNNTKLTSTEYLGNAATASQLKTGIKFNFADTITIDESKSNLTSVGNNDPISISISTIDSGKLIGKIPWSAIKLSTIKDEEHPDDFLALGNHNHDDIYLKSISIKNTEDSKIIIDSSSVTALSPTITEFNLKLNLAENSILENNINEKAISGKHIQLGVLCPKHFITPANGNSGDKSGDYSAKILLVEKSNHSTTVDENISSMPISTIFEKENDAYTGVVKKSTLAISANKLSSSVNLWGKSFDGTSGISGDITFQNASPLNDTSNIGSADNAFNEIYLKKSIHILDDTSTIDAEKAKLTINSIAFAEASKTENNVVIDAGKASIQAKNFIGLASNATNSINATNAEISDGLSGTINIFGKDYTINKNNRSISGDIEIGNILPNKKSNSEQTNHTGINIGSSTRAFNQIYGIYFSGKSEKAKVADSVYHKLYFLKNASETTATAAQNNRAFDGSKDITINLNSLLDTTLLKFKGSIVSESDATTKFQKQDNKIGDVWFSNYKGKFYTHSIEIGDMIICQKEFASSSTPNKNNFTVVQSNIDSSSFASISGDNKFTGNNTFENDITVKGHTLSSTYATITKTNPSFKNLIISDATSETDGAKFKFDKLDGTQTAEFGLNKVSYAFKADKLSKKLIFKYSDTQNVEYGNLTNDLNIKANELIKLKYENNVISIQHAQNSNGIKTAGNTGSAISTSTANTKLNFDDKFVIPTISYDQYGHITSSTSTILQLPSKPSHRKISYQSTASSAAVSFNDRNITFKAGDNIEFSAANDANDASSTLTIKSTVKAKTYSADAKYGITCENDTFKLSIPVGESGNPIVHSKQLPSKLDMETNASGMNENKENRLYPVLMAKAQSSRESFLSVYVPWETSIEASESNTDDAVTLFSSIFPDLNSYEQTSK